MEEIGNSQLDPIEDEISVSDPDSPNRLLSGSLGRIRDQAKEATEALYLSLVKEAPMIAQAHQALNRGFRLIVDASQSTLKAIEKGSIKLTNEKNGLMFAQIREANGHYGEKLPIKREVFCQGIDPAQMASALQMRAIQNQLRIVTEQLHLITVGVREMLQGLQNDRIGLYYSGLALFLEARNISDEDLKRSILGQSLQALAQASFQLRLKMQEDIQYLVREEYNDAKGSKRKEQMLIHLGSVKQSFAVIHQASMLRAGIYAHMGEETSLYTVLTEHSHFMDSIVTKHALLLSQLDPEDTGTETGIWRTLAKLNGNMIELNKQLKASEKVLYIDVVEVDKS